jgi:hypothetical protein
MKTKSINVETIISGFSHIIWMIMLIILLYPINNLAFITEFNNISIGAVAILAAIAFGASHFIGQLQYRIFADLSSLCKDPPDINKLNEAKKDNEKLAQDYNTSWLQKSFFRSMMFSLLLIMILAMCIDCKFNSCKASCIILIIGGSIEVFTIIAFITQRRDTEKKLKILMKDTNK